MTELDDDRLSPEEVAALAVERERPSIEDASAERMLRRLELAISVTPRGSGGEGGGGGGGGGPAGGGGSGMTQGAFAGATLKGAVLFVAGVVAGGAGMKLATTERPIDAVAVVDASPAVARPVADAGAPAIEAIEVHALPDPKRAPVSSDERVRPPASASNVDLVAESQLIDGVRTALGRRDPSAALALLVEHDARYRSGALREEAAALRVRALWATGRFEEGDRRAAEFRTRYPRSLFAPMITRPSSTVP